MRAIRRTVVWPSRKIRERLSTTKRYERTLTTGFDGSMQSWEYVRRRKAGGGVGPEPHRNAVLGPASTAEELSYPAPTTSSQTLVRPERPHSRGLPMKNLPQIRC